jgi:flagellar M-ring protein FliF
MPVDAEALKARALSAVKAFSPSQLVIAGLLGVVGLTGAFFFLNWVSAPTYGVLLAGLDAKDAAAVTAKLSADGVSYKLGAGGTTVLVPQSSLDKERIAVAAAGLPAGTTQDGWAAFDKQGLTSSSFQQQVAYQRALEATLADSLQGIDGVRSAQVHLALPEKRLFSENQDPARASVLVQTDGTLSQSTVDAMTHLVASAVPSMSPKDVSITDGSGNLLTGDGATTGRVDAQRRSYEDALSAQVGSMFDTLLGPGHAVVRVNAEIDNSNTTIDSQTYDPKQSAVLSQSTSTETYAPGTAATTSGGAITSANATGQLPTTTTTTTKSNGYAKSDSSVTNGVSVTTAHKVLAPGGIKRLTVAVAVDSNAKNLPPTADIQSMVANAVGLDPTRGDTIAVSTPAFLQTTGKDAKAAATTAHTSPVALATKYGPKALGALLLLLVGFGFLRAVKHGTATEIPADELTAAVEAGRMSAIPGHITAALPPGAVPAQRATTEDLLGVIDDSTDEVTGLIRGWLENAGAGPR